MTVKNNEQRISIDVDKNLWYEVGVQSAIMGISKKEYLKKALEQKVRQTKNRTN